MRTWPLKAGACGWSRTAQDTCSSTISACMCARNAMIACPNYVALHALTLSSVGLTQPLVVQPLCINLSRCHCVRFSCRTCVNVRGWSQLTSQTVVLCTRCALCFSVAGCMAWPCCRSIIHAAHRSDPLPCAPCRHHSCLNTLSNVSYWSSLVILLVL